MTFNNDKNVSREGNVFFVLEVIEKKSVINRSYLKRPIFYHSFPH